MSKSKTNRRRTAGKDKAVLEVLREQFKSRTPGMPLTLRAKIMASAAAVAAQEAGAAAVETKSKPARKRVRTPFFGFGYTGGLLAACLGLAVGLAWYSQNVREKNLQALRAVNSALPDGLIAGAVRAEAADLVNGRLSIQPVADAARRIESRDRNWTLAGARPSGIRSAAGDPTSATWFVFTNGGDRIAVLVSPLGGDKGDPTATLDKPLVRTEGELLVAAAREGRTVVVACGAIGREALERFMRSLSAGSGR